MPKLWSQTIDEHRRDVRQAILDTSRLLVDEGGLRSVTMSRIADRVGIGRATLYKYFPNVEAILDAHHEQHIAQQLALLTRMSEEPGEPLDRLTRILEAYAQICYHRQENGSHEVFAMLHRPDVVRAPESQIQQLIHVRIADLADTEGVRDEMPIEELAHFSMHALGAAGQLRSQAAVRRLVTMTLAGILHSERHA